MKKLIACIMVIVTLSGCTVAEQAQLASMSVSPSVTQSIVTAGDDFRTASWGMTKDEVKAVEKNKLLNESDGLLVYEDEQISANDFTVLFHFDDKGKLYLGQYILNEKFVNENNYVELTRTTLMELIDKYGKPTKYDGTWSNKQYANKPDKMGMAVITGGYRVDVFWELSDRIVGLQLYGENYKANLVISYAVPNVKDIPSSSDSNL